MSFQKPELLWLLLAIVVPLVLYLLPMPRQRVMSSALYLWERFLQSEVLGRTSERFRRALGFALLAIILAALAAAAAEMTLGRSPVDARRLLVLVDVSASMNALSDDRSNLDRAMHAARELVASLGTGTEVAVAVAADRLRLVGQFAPAGREAASQIADIAPSDLACDLRRRMEDAFDLWGADDDCHIYVFTDGPVPESRWGQRAHGWIAPPALDNAAIVGLTAQRRGKKIVARCTLANYGRTARTLAGAILVNDVPRGSLGKVSLAPGATIEKSATIQESGAATLRVRLEGEPDALATDDEALADVPGWEDLRVRVVWPPAGKHNAYVSAVLASLQEEGIVGPISETAAPAAVTVYVNHAPAAWPEASAIVLHPLRPGVIGVSGLHSEPVTISRQAAHFLLDGVELRGLVVKDAVHAEPPSWAEPLAWAGDLPLVWAGENGKNKTAVVAMPLTVDGSRLALSASFPVLVRNACLWMLPSSKAGAIGNAESDLRRAAVEEEQPQPKRHRLAWALVVLAMVLLPIEWGLFHRRMTE